MSSQAGQTIIRNYDKYLPRLSLKKPRHALLSYLTEPVVSDLRGEKLVRFSNHGLAVGWAKTLNKLGYIVDIIDWDNKSYSSAKDYDLVIFHGGKNFSNIMPALKNHPKIIHWLTGSYWKFNNSQEDKRLKDFARRHGVTVARDRYIYESEDEVNEAAEAIIVLGDPTMKETYPSKYKKVLTVNNASYPDDHFDTHKKNYGQAKNNFLFFAGSGNIHKGLDLLIDSFKDLDEHLYIVAHTDKDVLRVFKKELERPNIHLFGEVGMRTDPFYEVMNTCAFVILPSCSEGQAGSVIEAMNQGLIPIVSKETRLDTKNYGFTLLKSSIQEIRQTVLQAASMSADEVRALSRRTRRVALKDHSSKSFENQLKKAILVALR